MKLLIKFKKLTFMKLKFVNDQKIIGNKIININYNFNKILNNVGCISN